MKVKKQNLIKIALSIPIFIFCLLALADILSGGEPLIDEFIILGLGITWFIYLKKPFKPPRFLTAFIIFLGSSVLHNIISYLIHFEEPVFFFLALLSFATSVILFLIFIFKRLKNVLKKKKKC